MPVLAYKPRAKKVKLRFYFGTCLYGSDFRSWDTWAKVKRGKASFTFRYYYGSDKTPPEEGLGKAHATVKFGKGCVWVKHRVLYLAGARFGFDTNGRFIKIKRGVHRKYVD